MSNFCLAAELKLLNIVIYFQVAIRAAFLEQENVQLKWEVSKLKNETDQLKKTLISFGTGQDSGFESA